MRKVILLNAFLAFDAITTIGTKRARLTMAIFAPLFIVFIVVREARAIPVFYKKRNCAGDAAYYYSLCYLSPIHDEHWRGGSCEVNKDIFIYFAH